MALLYGPAARCKPKMNDLEVVGLALLYPALERNVCGCAAARHHMADRIRIIKHEAVARCGSYEVLFADGRTSVTQSSPRGCIRCATVQKLGVGPFKCNLGNQYFLVFGAPHQRATWGQAMKRNVLWYATPLAWTLIFLGAAVFAIFS
jgi:hypothetical protein